MGNIIADLHGRVALVTGGGKGIGQAIAVSLAECGASVVVSSRTQKDLEVTRQMIQERGGECLIITADVQKVDEINSLIDSSFEWHRRLDILVNSAGINIPKPSLEVTEKDWDNVIDTNLKGTFFACQAAGRKMIQQGKGKIINITSQMAFVGFHKRAAYCASKGGVTQLTKVLAGEWGRFGIRVNCVAPTFVQTPMTEPMFEDEEFMQEVLSRIPLGYIGKPSDVTGAVIYLASDASDMVTGSTILVDGGWVAW